MFPYGTIDTTTLALLELCVDTYAHTQLRICKLKMILFHKKEEL